MSKITKESLWTVEIRYGEGEGRCYNFVGQPGFYTLLDAIIYEEADLESYHPTDIVTQLMSHLKTIRKIMEQHNTPLDHRPGWHPFSVGRSVIGHYRISISVVFIRRGEL